MKGSYLIDVAKHHLPDNVVLQNFTNDTAVTASNNQRFLRVWMTGQWKMRNHRIVSDLIIRGDNHKYSENLDSRQFVPFSALNDPVQHKDISECLRFEYEDILIKGSLDVQNLVDFQSDRSTWPLQ